MKAIESTCQTEETFSKGLTSQCGAYQVEYDDENPFRGYLNGRKLGDIELAQVGTSARNIVRNSKHVKADHADHFFVLMQYEGASIIEHNKKQVHLSPRDLIIIDANRSSQFFSKTNYCHYLSIQISRDDFIRRFGHNYYGAAHITGNDPLCQAMWLILDSLTSCSDENANASQLDDSFFSILGSQFLSIRDGSTPSCVEEMLYEQALIIINSNHKDPQFTVQDIATKMNISTRQLQRAFKRFGNTPYKVIQSSRLYSATRLLKRTSHNKSCEGSVTEIVMSSGFNDLSTFYRLFKKHHQCKPLDMVSGFKM